MYPVDITIDIANEPKHYTQGDIVKGVAHFKIATKDGKVKYKAKGDADDGVKFDWVQLDFEGKALSQHCLHHA